MIIKKLLAKNILLTMRVKIIFERAYFGSTQIF